MQDTFLQILEAARKQDFYALSRFHKHDFFEFTPAAIQAEMVLDQLELVLLSLANKGEFITEAEWKETRFGHALNKSLEELYGNRNPNIRLAHGHVCNDYVLKKLNELATSPANTLTQNTEPAPESLQPVLEPPPPAIEHPTAEEEKHWVEAVEKANAGKRLFKRPPNLERTPRIIE